MEIHNKFFGVNISVFHSLIPLDFIHCIYHSLNRLTLHGVGNSVQIHSSVVAIIPVKTEQIQLIVHHFLFRLHGKHQTGHLQ